MRFPLIEIPLLILAVTARCPLRPLVWAVRSTAPQFVDRAFDDVVP
jgi:hypothetical protein